MAPPSAKQDAGLTEDDKGAALKVLEALIGMLNNQETDDTVEELIGQLTPEARQYLRELLVIHLETRGDPH